ncbi:MAG TPA: hypothetical protein VKA67_06520 [Verrucomicrobiae bacterium]|nr:hypothetical protein [Verrucomicrobiae bacterium]
MARFNRKTRQLRERKAESTAMRLPPSTPRELCHSAQRWTTQSAYAVSETRREKNWFGKTKTDETGSPISYQFSKSGQKTGSTQQKKTWFGNTKLDENGKPIQFRKSE